MNYVDIYLENRGKPEIFTLIKDLEGDTYGHLNELCRHLSGKLRETRNIYVREVATLLCSVGLKTELPYTVLCTDRISFYCCAHRQQYNVLT